VVLQNHFGHQKKQQEVQANPAADLEGGGVILRIPPDSCGSLC